MSRNADESRAERIRAILETEGPAVSANASLLNEKRYDAIDSFPAYDELRSEARGIKEDAIAQLPELIDRVTEAVEDNGGTVYLAADAADANAYVESVAADRGVDSVVKSKSMTTEEIEVNDHLESREIDVWETDLGEFVLQVADEAPSHLVGPAMHKSRAEIAALFNGHFEPEEPLETAEELTRFARDYLGERIREADMGMTGANFVLAESGTIVLVTNEGNARKSAVTPDTHVAVAGVEKLLPSVAELEPFVQLIARAATGQPIAQYVSMLSPPTESPTLDFESDELGGGDREFHLVLLDNGRFDLREDDELRETLYCIRCGACANSCANFQSVGGHAFGGETYTGGIATGWEAGVHGAESVAEFNDLCTGCTRCVNACPVEIDIPWINTVVRDRLNRGQDPDRFDHLVDGLLPDEEAPGFTLQKRLFGNFESLARVGSATAPVSNRLASSRPVRAVLERAVGIDRRRELPTFARRTLIDWFDARGGSRVAPADATREAVVYPDTYTNYLSPERGKATVRALESLGVAVRVPPVGESGRAPLSQGMVDTARARASDVYGSLAEHVDAGRDVVVIEPSDHAMIHREYERLLPAASARRLRESSYDVMEYVYGLLENGADADALRAGDGEAVAYHGHCQGRTLGTDAYAVAVLERLGYDVRTSDVECCGMAGSFGYKRAYYELSVDVGEPLADSFADAETVLASGTSCGEQLEALLERPARHPIEHVGPQ
ncbi:LUD domain-containing protein [Natrononativus amylolyticus]|uniref:LUD domain-containing protein n=1 Tax=Natrononativus amylolyticus TaxID=2963434 RepID=UPI0020CDB369|nr:LUD domain-containing protein [Natrononativus amylolyticus]